MLTLPDAQTSRIVATLAVSCLIAVAVVPLRPLLGVHAWVALLPFQFAFLRDRLNFNFAPSDIVAVGLVVALGADLLRHTRGRAGGRAATIGLSFMVPLTVSLVIGLASGTYASYAVVNKWLGYLFLALTALAIARILQDDFGAVVRVTRTFLIAVFVSTVISVVTYWLGYDTLWLWSAVQSDRLAGTLLEAPPFGALLVVAFLIQATLLLAGRRVLSPVFDWMNCLLIFHAICLTFARSAWAGLGLGAVSVLVFVVPNRRSLKIRRLVPLTLALLFVAAGAFAAAFERHAKDVTVATSDARQSAATLLDRFLERLPVSRDVHQFLSAMFVREWTANIRYTQIAEGLRLWTDAPFAGIGLGRFLFESPRWFGHPYQIHNTFVWILVEMGVLGFLWFCAFTWMVIDEYRIGLRSADDRKWWAVGFCAAFVSLLGFMLGTEGLYQRQLWLLVGVAGAVGAGRARDRPLAMQVVTRLNVGGITHQVIVLAEELRQAGYASEIAAGQPAPAEGNRADSARDAGLEVHDLAHLSNRINPLRDLRACVELFALFRRRRPVVVHLYMLKARILGAVTARLAGVPVVVETLHGNLLQGYYNRFATRLILVCERVLGWLVVDRVIAPTRSQRAELLAFRIAPADRVVAQLPGMDVSGFAVLANRRQALRQQLGITESVVLIGIIGRLVPIKGFDIFLASAARLRHQKADDVFFVIAGDGPLRQELESDAERLGLADRCVFLGQVTDVAGFYAACDIIVMSSRNEGAPIALLEAMGAGNAIVATNVGGIPDMVHDGVSALLVPKEDAEALAAAMLRLVNDPAARSRLGGAAKERTSEFTVPRFAEVTAALYDELARGSR
jgi:glycosyltransferase involved in cell wall biosynthesis